MMLMGDEILDGSWINSQEGSEEQRYMWISHSAVGPQEKSFVDVGITANKLVDSKLHGAVITPEGGLLRPSCRERSLMPNPMLSQSLLHCLQNDRRSCKGGFLIGQQYSR